MPRDGKGNPVHSFSRGKLNDEINASQPSHPSVSPKSRPSGKQPDPDGEMGEQSPEDIRDVVKEHGPAHTVHMESDHEAGMHQVHSFHGGNKPGGEGGGGFTHHSKHGSHHEAHKHAGLALGMDAGHEDTESPSYEAKEEKAMSIPGMG